MTRWRNWLLALAVLLAGVSALAQVQQEAQTTAQDPRLEAEVNRIGLELRCLVCQNQTISDSNAGLAIDLKNQIREQLKAGRSEAQILDFMAERYGDFVLYRPPVKAITLLLWVGPFALLAIGVLTGVMIVRRRRRDADSAVPLTEAQRQQAAQLLQEEPETRS